MKFVLTLTAGIGLAASVVSVPALAQMQNNIEKQLTCNNSNSDRDRARHCEVREQSLPSIGRLNIDASPNGGVTVKGWTRGDVLVRARIEAQADNEGAAANLVSRVMIDGNGGQVRASGPDGGRDASWSVTYEVFVPQLSDVTLKSRNGGLTVSDVRGQIEFEAMNGGVHLRRVAGEVKGATMNGGIDVELSGNASDLRQVDLKTTNGGVTLAMPAHAAARIQAETGMGRIQSDFPMPLSADARSRKMDFNIGAGGPPIHITTGNGGIRLKRSEGVK